MLPELTDRENDPLQLIADGLTNREISCNLSISESPFENHLHHAFIKLVISHWAQAVAYVFRMKTLLQCRVVENKGNPS